MIYDRSIHVLRTQSCCPFFYDARVILLLCIYPFVLFRKWWLKWINMCIRQSCHWLSKPRIGRLKIVLLGVFTILLSFLHLVALPQVSGGYNEECLTPEWKRQILRTMVQNISRAFDKFNVKYWIDYGKMHSLYVYLRRRIWRRRRLISALVVLCAWAVCIFSKHT